jgi:hypothetical protein
LIAAGLTLLAALVVVAIVHRVMRGRMHKLPDALGGGELSPMLDTRLRFLRRASRRRSSWWGSRWPSRSSRASTASPPPCWPRAPSPRPSSGSRPARCSPTRSRAWSWPVTQPLRIGDLVTFEGETGTVEDVSLTYTWLRTGSDARLIIPNERLAAGVLRNDSIRSATVALEVSAWLAPDADETTPWRRSRPCRRRRPRASPRSPTSASACRWRGRRWRPPSA